MNNIIPHNKYHDNRLRQFLCWSVTTICKIISKNHEYPTFNWTTYHETSEKKDKKNASFINNKNGVNSIILVSIVTDIILLHFLYHEN